MTGSDVAVVWFRQDLRLADNPALLAAVKASGAVVPVFIWSPEEEGRWTPGAASRWWLHHSLSKLDASLRERGSRLIIRRGPALQAIRQLLRQTGAQTVYWNRRYEPAAIALDRKLQSTLQRQGVLAHCMNGSLLFEPEAITTKDDKPYQIFTAFWRTCLKSPAPLSPEHAPSAIKAPRRWPVSLKVSELNLQPTTDWADGIEASWKPGEAGAIDQLRRFRKIINRYPVGRDRPGEVGTSRLSPHLHFGEISVRQIWHAVRSGGETESVKRYCGELGWREFAHHLLFHFPHTPEKPLRPQFSRFPWVKNRAHLKAWQRGRTGFPIVDAGMRELWHTGWMHNRVRMIVASFLVKDLLITWREGADWFWDTLVDADLANNTLGWQWTAGCGADAAPYFRVFNPITQGQKFDPDGGYVRRWVPELAALPAKWIHAPWEAPEAVLAGAKIMLGDNYPRPIVDHGIARSRALAAFKQMRK